jgi:hypothetical protein
MKIFYIRKDKTKSKGQTVVTIVHELDTETKKIKLGYSVCSKHDQFQKWKGIYYAAQRFDNIGNKESSEGFGKFSGEFLYVGELKHNIIKVAVKQKVLQMIKESGLHVKL